MKNKIIAMMLCGLLLVSMAACGDSQAPADDKGNAGQAENNQQEQTPEGQDGDAADPQGEGKDAQGSQENGGDSQAPEEAGGSQEEAFSLAMTDTYTFTDPEGLEFDKRYVLTGDENCKLLSDMINAGYDVTAMYDIVYENQEEAAGEYQYFVTPDEESAKALADFYQAQGQAVTQEGNILYAYVDGEVLKANIMTFSSMNMMSGDTVEDYISFMMGTYGLIEY